MPLILDGTSGVSASGNVTGAFLFGNASTVTGLSASKIFNGTTEATWAHRAAISHLQWLAQQLLAFLLRVFLINNPTELETLAQQQHISTLCLPKQQVRNTLTWQKIT